MGSVRISYESPTTTGTNSPRKLRADLKRSEKNPCDLLREAGRSSGIGLVRRDGFDQASNGEGVADASGAANEMNGAAFARELNRNTDQRGNAGAVDLRNAVEVDDYFAAAALHDGLQRFVKLLGGFADGEPSVDFQQINSVLLPNGNLHGYVLGHLTISQNSLAVGQRISAKPDRLGLYDHKPLLDNRSIKILNCGYEKFITGRYGSPTRIIRRVEVSSLLQRTGERIGSGYRI